MRKKNKWKGRNETIAKALNLLYLTGLFLLFGLFVSCKKKDFFEFTLKKHLEAGAVQDSLLLYEKYRGYYYKDSALNALCAGQHYREALHYLEGIEYRREGYFSIPYYLLAKGNLMYALHEYDSACHYYKLAAHNIDRRIAAEANRRLSALELGQGRPEKAYSFYREYQHLFSLEVDRELQSNLYARYQEAVLKARLNEVDAARRIRELWIMGLSAGGLLVAAVAYILYICRRRSRMKKDYATQAHLLQVEQRALREEARNLAHENLLLKQAEELQKLREIQFNLRESLFRRMSVWEKIPSLHVETETDASPSQRIALTDKDWEELRLWIDAAYPGFTRRLQERFPSLTESDLNFCCLLKIGVNLHDLSNIYCISKASISTKKFRLKREKFNLAEAEPTLENYLQIF